MMFRRTITKDFTAIRVLQAEIVAEAERLRFGETRLFEVKLTVEESLINAIKRFRSGAKLYVEAQLDGSGVTIVVREAE
jgi:hypothetical protein